VIPPRRVLAALAALALPLAACGQAAPLTKNASASDIVLCPPGATYHAGEGRCVAEHPARTATAPSAPLPAAAPSAAPSAPLPIATPASVKVTCAFANGWAAVVPASVYPRDDEFVMQALIGFANEPQFWQDQTEYAALEPYKAVACDSHGVTVGASEGDVFVLVGEAETFAKRNRYSRNGMLKKITLKKGDAPVIDVAPKDLTRTFPCISCPWLHFEGEGGARTEPFVLLARRGSREERGQDQKTLRVPVVDGAVKVVVEEHEDETTYLDALTVHAGGLALAPQLPPHAPSARFALAADDGLEVVIPRGTRIEQRYLVPPGAASGGWITVTVAATGHYVPNTP